MNKIILRKVCDTYVFTATGYKEEITGNASKVARFIGCHRKSLSYGMSGTVNSRTWNGWHITRTQTPKKDIFRSAYNGEVLYENIHRSQLKDIIGRLYQGGFQNLKSIYHPDLYHYKGWLFSKELDVSMLDFKKYTNYYGEDTYREYFGPGPKYIIEAAGCNMSQSHYQTATIRLKEWDTIDIGDLTIYRNRVQTREELND